MCVCVLFVWLLLVMVVGVVCDLCDFLDDYGGWIVVLVFGMVVQVFVLVGWFDEVVLFDECDYWYWFELCGCGLCILCFYGFVMFVQVWFDDMLIYYLDSMFVVYDVLVLFDGMYWLIVCFCVFVLYLCDVCVLCCVCWCMWFVELVVLCMICMLLFGYMLGWFLLYVLIGLWWFVDVFDLVDVFVLSDCKLYVCVDGDMGWFDVELMFVVLLFELFVVWLLCGDYYVMFECVSVGQLCVSVVILNVCCWWLYMYGELVFYEIMLYIGDVCLLFGLMGFCMIEIDFGVDGKGFGLCINGVFVFVCGVCWSSVVLFVLYVDDVIYGCLFGFVCDVGFNMICVGGMMIYEVDVFYVWCDWFGLLVWQEFGFVNFDYVFDDFVFVVNVDCEVSQLLLCYGVLLLLVVLCGGSEIV